MTREEVRFAAFRWAVDKGYGLTNLPALVDVVDSVEDIVCGPRVVGEAETPPATDGESGETPAAGDGAGEEQNSGSPEKAPPKKAAK